MAEKRSLVIGGFHVTESIDKHSKVPLLGVIFLYWARRCFPRLNDRTIGANVCLSSRHASSATRPTRHVTCPRQTRPNCRPLSPPGQAL